MKIVWIELDAIEITLMTIIIVSFGIGFAIGAVIQSLGKW